MKVPRLPRPRLPNQVQKEILIGRARLRQPRQQRLPVNGREVVVVVVVVGSSCGGCDGCGGLAVMEVAGSSSLGRGETGGGCRGPGGVGRSALAGVPLVGLLASWRRRCGDPAAWTHAR